ncbi:carboxymuconolactone decarboxylase family protein [Trueperella bialowiezensis]|uniref:carboxymuconolactone decarboxylase family protein n=1 Tax=Trueperella bialowiezensis TaxID=312285 RepID=UPI000F840816|nr:carboxymuconolactone decarboxylase family protein [Trueperella bialowiezensis]
MTRFNISKKFPELQKPLNKAAMESAKVSRANGISDELRELINVRVSQINGCVACLRSHVPALREAGMADELIDLIPAWRDVEAPFTPEQRVALGLAEAFTIMDHATDRDMIIDEARDYFTDDQIAAIEWTTILINAFNRISIANG